MRRLQAMVMAVAAGRRRQWLQRRAVMMVVAVAAGATEAAQTVQLARAGAAGVAWAWRAAARRRRRGRRWRGRQHEKGLRHKGGEGRRFEGGARGAETPAPQARFEPGEQILARPIEVV